MSVTSPAGFAVWRLPADIDTPALVVDAARLDRNIAAMALVMGRRGVALRPHVKTHKCVQIARLQLAAGAAGITAATLGEAEVFAAAGITDVFIAYPLWASAAKAARLVSLAETATLLLGADSVAGASQLGAAFTGRARRPELLVEVESGEVRTGVRTPAEAVAVAGAARDAGLTVVGVFTHGGHSYAGRDAAGPAAADEHDALAAAGRALAAAGHPVRVRSAGSTPTASLPAAADALPDPVTEQRPGTYVFFDRQQAALGACSPDDVAMMVASTVVSAPEPGRFVLDAGAKVLTKDCPATLTGFGALPGYPRARVVRLYDHHAVVEAGGGPAPAVGEMVCLVPNHACPVSNLATEFVVLRDGRVAGRWPVDARGRSR